MYLVAFALFQKPNIMVTERLDIPVFCLSESSHSKKKFKESVLNSKTPKVICDYTETAKYGPPVVLL